jgi:hypothetical protein
MNNSEVNEVKVERRNHCWNVNRTSICSNPSKQCYYFKHGFQDCFFNIQKRCCNSVAVSDALNF